MANIVSYSWDFGNGEQSDADSPIAVYTPGLYTVTMTAVYDDGTTDVVTKDVYITVADGNNNNATSDYIEFPKSFHFGWDDAHGYGWSENSGDAFIWPEASASVFQYESNGNVEKVVWDIYTRKPYVINTRDSYHGDAIYEDRADINGDNGTAIATEITFPEFTGERKHMDITHTETNIRFRPEINEDELPVTLDIDIALLVGDREEQVDLRKNIDSEKEVTFYYQNNKLGNSATNQLKVLTSESKYQMMGFESYFRTNDRFKSPAKYTANEAVIALQSPLVWRTRWNYALDRSTALSDASMVATTTQGADGREDSAIDFTTITITYPENVQSVMYWSKDLGLGLTKYGVPVNGWQLYYENAVVPAGDVVMSSGSMFDYRAFDFALDNTYIEDYYDNIANYLPR